MENGKESTVFLQFHFDYTEMRGGFTEIHRERCAIIPLRIFVRLCESL
jgi:hypothetical protein